MEDEYLSLTKKGEILFKTILKAKIEGLTKEALEYNIEKALKDKEWNEIIGKDEESVIK